MKRKQELKNNALEKAINAQVGKDNKANYYNEENFNDTNFQSSENNNEEKSNLKKGEKQKKKNGKIKGLTVAVITLSILSLIFGGTLIYVFLMPNKMENELESIYKKSFYDTATQVDNMDNNMSKFLATVDNGARQTFLVDLAINSELCESDIQALPLQDENKYYTMKTYMRKFLQ